MDKIKSQQQSQSSDEELSKLDRQITTLQERLAGYESVERIPTIEAKINNTQARLDKVLERKALLTEK